MNHVAALTISALTEYSNEHLPHYEATLIEACEAHPPPFGKFWYGDRYREYATDPQWMASSLVANASKEGDGARTLWTLAGSIEDKTVASQVKDHAVDEARHSHLYIKMLELCFPESVDIESRKALYSIAPSYSSKLPLPIEQPKNPDIVLDEIIQMNIGEIRTRIHQLLLQPVLLTWCPDSDKNRVKRILDSILFDETRHIHYTACLIEASVASGKEDFVKLSMQQRLADFNELTLQEVGGAALEGIAL